MSTTGTSSARGNEHSLLRKAARKDLPSIVDIHKSAFKHSFLTMLGESFLHRYYKLVLDYRSGILLTSQSGSGLEGFVSGFGNPEEFYGLMKQNRRAFALPILSGLVRNPLLAGRVLRGIRRVQGPAPERIAPCCELSSIAVRPEAAGRGIGKALLKAFLEQAWTMGAGHVYLTTDADDNEAVNALYRKAGFSLCRRFEQHRGRWMNEYAFECPAVQRRAAG